MDKALCLATAGIVNTNDNPNSIIFTIKDTKLYVPVVALSAKDNHKLSKLLSKGLERSMYWNKYQTKSGNKHLTNRYRYFLESNFVAFNRLFVLVYFNWKNDIKRYNVLRYYIAKRII